MHCEIRDRSGNVSLYVPHYGIWLHTIETRKSSLGSLLTLVTSMGSYPWLLSGDFNSPLCEDDRINGSPISVVEYRDFEEFIGLVGPCPIRSVGHYIS